MSPESRTMKKVTVRLLGTDGVGISQILRLLSVFAARGGAGGEIDGGCCIRMKGVELHILETHFADLKASTPEADMWYLVVAADDGPIDLD